MPSGDLTGIFSRYSFTFGLDASAHAEKLSDRPRATVALETGGLICIKARLPGAYYPISLLGREGAVGNLN